ncbi:MAG: HAD-IC family P-type ATPase, partial [Chloroflexota bacterium]
RELAAMDDSAFAEAAESVTVFGRVSPEQKARLIESLVSRGRYPAMIGDGINDILALKKARLSIAMQGGSNATRSVADMILIDDSYGVLALGLVESRKVINGLTNATYLIVARAITYAFVIVGVVMVGLEFPFEPAQTAVTAITVGIPSFALVFWAREDKKRESLLPSLLRFVLPVAIWSTLIGVSIFSFVHFRASEFFLDGPQSGRAIARFAAYTGLVFENDAEARLAAGRLYAQTVLSAFLSLTGFMLVFFLEPPASLLSGWRAVSPDRRPVVMAAGLAAVLVTAFCVPAVADYLGFIPPGLPLWGIIGSGLALWTAGLALFWRTGSMDRLLSADR